MIDTLTLAPLRELESIRDEVERAFRVWAGPRQGGDGASLVRAAMTVQERDDGYHLTFEMPGVTPDDVDIEADDRTLRIRGQRGGEGEPYFIRYERMLALPDNADMERVQAELRNGVLYLTVPKRTQSQPRRVELSGASTGQASEAADTASDAESQGLHATDGLRG